MCLAFLHGNPWLLVLFVVAALFGAACLLVNLGLYLVWLFRSDRSAFYPTAIYLVQAFASATIALSTDDTIFSLLGWGPLFALTLPWNLFVWTVLEYFVDVSKNEIVMAGSVGLCIALNGLVVFGVSSLARRRARGNGVSPSQA